MNWFTAKPRIILDAFVIGLFMIMAALCVLRFPELYLEGRVTREVSDVLGFFLIIVGTLLRMSGRGFKKHASRQGFMLVTDGPYKLVRNPMYLGTFLIAIGCMFPLYPLWAIPIFGCVFYSRFVIQIRIEEEWLSRKFTAEYDAYCRAIPSFFPTVKSFRNAGLSNIFFKKYLWSTKEKFGLIYWPFVSISLNLLEDWFLWGQMDLTHIGNDFLLAAVFLALLLGRK